ncbi:MAG TPA: D-arabinono-1,4-lactone oxidase [Pseudonocardiaceae bacterium]|nr:D-arabinono-1,4-lactone oxidase [Pseudonocardiaceae bacterium]
MAQRTWRNWAGTATATPARWAAPRDPAEIGAAIQAAERDGLTVRAIGAGHSFTAVAATDGVALDLSGWQGIVRADATTGEVTVRAGTTLAQLNAALDPLGLALANLGDIDAQTVAGALATGTHGTGAKLGGLTTQIRAMELVLADGSEVSCSSGERPELFQATRLGLGALGVVSTVTLACVPAFVLAADERPERIEDLIERFDELADTNDHFEFHWFPHGRNALVKRNNRLPEGAAPKPMPRARQFLEYEVLENVAVGTIARINRAAPRTVPGSQRLIDKLMSVRSYSDVSHRVFVTPRNVRFVESEYALPRAELPAVLRELRTRIPKLADQPAFPLEIRVAAADDIWLSTASGRDTAYIAIHQFQGMPYRQYFDLFESIVAEVDGRPHWGKMHSLDADTLAKRYPRFEDFRRVRAETDPAGRFGNAYLSRVLGPIG